MTIFRHFGKLLLGAFFLVLYCEVIIYYVVLLQCSWPIIEKTSSDHNFASNQLPLKVMLLADPHLLGPIHGHWFDKLRRMFCYKSYFPTHKQTLQPFQAEAVKVINLTSAREWQMFRTFQTAMMLHKPNVVFILDLCFDAQLCRQGNILVQRFNLLQIKDDFCNTCCDFGDLFDEGFETNKEQFNSYVKRFRTIFQVPADTQLYVVPGNHDMGFHYWIRKDLKNRFEEAFSTTPIEMIDIRENIFVLINSMAMEGDGCFLCRSASEKLHNISLTLSYRKNKNKYITHEEIFQEYGRPVLLQHFPMYRKSDENCNEPDGMPAGEKQEHFRENWECLSQVASKKIFKLLRPRIIFTGHTHYGCHIVHKNQIHEWTLPSFNWRNHKSPSFALAVFTPYSHAVSKCYMPQETTVIWTYIIGGLLFLIVIRRKFIPFNFVKYKCN